MSPPDEPELRPSRFDELVGPVFSDPALHPILITVSLVLITFGTWLLLLVFRDRSFAGLASGLVFALLSLDYLQRDLRRKRLSRMGVWILVLWA